MTAPRPRRRLRPVSPSRFTRHRSNLRFQPTDDRIGRFDARYRRTGDAAACAPRENALRHFVADSPQAGADFVDLTVVEFGVHTAFLDPLTGTGLLVLPLADHDVPPPAPAQPVHPAGLSLYCADWQSALDKLERLGWSLLDDNGELDVAGHTVDGRPAVCLLADHPIMQDPDIATIRSTLAALRFAAGVSAR